MKPLILAVALMLAAAVPVQAQDDGDTNALDDTPHVTVVGAASTEVTPDLAIITLGVTSHKATAAAAADAVASGAQAIVEAAKGRGVKEPDIATQSINLGQSFDEVHDPQGRFLSRKPSGFDAATTIAIRIRDLAKAGELAQSLIDQGANSFDGIAFTVEHPQPILDKLAAEAVSNARHQAEMVAQAAGVKLGRVLLIERPGSRAMQTPHAFAPMARAAGVVAKAMPVQAGTASFEAEMEVTWAIDR